MGISAKKKGLTSRDLIGLGIFNAIAIICYSIVAMIACTTIFGMFVSTAAAFLVVGTVYMLMAVKIKKKGVFLICGVLMGIFGLVGGHIYHAVASLLGGVLAELAAGRYENLKRIVVSYVIFAVFDFCGIFLPSFLLGADYMMSMAAKYGMTPEMLESYLKYYTGPVFAVLLAANIICAFLGAMIGIGFLKKHFQKAGLIG